jgi:hypothetical protein
MRQLQVSFIADFQAGESTTLRDLPIWKSAIEQIWKVWKPTLRNGSWLNALSKQLWQIRSRSSVHF